MFAVLGKYNDLLKNNRSFGRLKSAYFFLSLNANLKIGTLWASFVTKLRFFSEKV